jgi:hypothetical protein
MDALLSGLWGVLNAFVYRRALAVVQTRFFTLLGVTYGFFYLHWTGMLYFPIFRVVSILLLIFFSSGPVVDVPLLTFFSLLGTVPCWLPVLDAALQLDHNI